MNKQALTKFQEHLHDKDYFNCHEVLEEIWKIEDEKLNKDTGYVCLIQYATALHHLKNDNITGFKKTLKNLESHLTDSARDEIREHFINFDVQYDKLLNLDTYEVLNLYLKDDLLKYIEKNKVVNTFAFANIDDIVDIEIYYIDAEVCGYVFTNSTNHLIINISEKTSNNILNEARTFIKKQHEQNQFLIDFTCDKITKDLLFRDSDFEQLFTSSQNFLAYLDSKIDFQSELDFVKPNENDYDKYISFTNKVFNQNKQVQGNLFPKSLIENTIVLYDKNNDIIFSASSTDKTKQTAMIIGVATDENYRNKGYATAGVKKLCYEIMLNNSIPVLFYNNPNAASIYKKIGFKDIDTQYYIITFK